jgi:4-hydroxy-tetrahydrodipicolinate synthase
MNQIRPGLDATQKAIQRLVGIHAATVCPMRPDFSVDEAVLTEHARTVASTPGIEGLLINGHAGENFLLTAAEKKRVITIVRAAVGPRAFLTSGVNAEASLAAAAEARDAEEAGADAILLFPPNSWALAQDEEAVLLHHHHVSAACNLPLLLYQAPVSAGAMGYPRTTLERLVVLPRVAGIKEGSWEVATYEENRRAAKALRPDLAVLGSGDEHLLTSYLIGSEGSQVSLAAIVPELVVALWRAAHESDWSAARRWHDALYPLAIAIYREPPGGRATTRLKACLKILGRIEHDAVRPPLAPLPAEECRKLEEALSAAERQAVRLRELDPPLAIGQKRSRIRSSR